MATTLQCSIARALAGLTFGFGLLRAFASAKQLDARSGKLDRAVSCLVCHRSQLKWNALPHLSASYHILPHLTTSYGTPSLRGDIPMPPGGDAAAGQAGAGVAVFGTRYCLYGPVFQVPLRELSSNLQHMAMLRLFMTASSDRALHAAIPCPQSSRTATSQAWKKEPL